MPLNIMVALLCYLKVHTKDIQHKIQNQPENYIFLQVICHLQVWNVKKWSQQLHMDLESEWGTPSEHRDFQICCTNDYWHHSCQRHSIWWQCCGHRWGEPGHWEQGGNNSVYYSKYLQPEWVETKLYFCSVSLDCCIESISCIDTVCLCNCWQMV